MIFTEDSLNNLRIGKICEKYGVSYLENEPLSQYTSFRIGGPCPFLIKPASAEALCDIVKAFDSENIPFRVMGRGSNLLISDKGVRFPVILISSEMSRITVNEDRVICEAGASLTSLCKTAEQNCLSGLEFAYGIPGSVGGAVYMNAGAYGGEIKDVFESCTYVDEHGNMNVLTADKADLSYRHSFFSGKPYIITEMTVKLHKTDNKAEITAKMQELMNKRREKQPLEYPSAGSTFKRPEGDFAGRLIEAAGLRGFSVGGAAVSEKHCGFVINKNNATFEDTKKLIETIKEKVRETSGRELACEVIIWE